MTPIQYYEAGRLQEEMNKLDIKIHRIGRLLQVDKIGCDIKGTNQKGRTDIISYTSYNKELINRILEEDRIKLQTELAILQKQFNAL